MENTHCFAPADILLPDASVSPGQWGCIACDQFTSDPAYWAEARQLTAGAPTTLDLILPEVYLDAPDVAQRIAGIHAAMQRYARTLLTRQVHGYVYVERTLQNGTVRQGLVGALDLEHYSYAPGALPPVRPTESTVVQRIPPRLAVRRGACLELPHVMMLADDPACTLIEPIAAQKAALPLLYAGELMLGGGHIAGWAVQDPALIARIAAAVDALGSQAAFDRKYPAAAGAPPLTLAVGDGNHSLATAKAYWEELKPTLSAAQQASHPARWCLAEVCNLHAPAMDVQPIHRALFGVSAGQVLAALQAYSQAQGLGLQPGCAGAQPVQLLAGGTQRQLCFAHPRAPLAAGTIEAFIDAFLVQYPQARVDYIHDEPALRALCADGAVGLLLPPLAKGDLFAGVVLGGVLPRKTFSLGHAREKRYYGECRRILP